MIDGTDPGDDGSPAPTEASSLAAPAVEAAVTPVPAPPALLRPGTRYTARFATVYGALAVVLIGAVTGIVVLLIGWSGFGSGGSASWSPWKPSGKTTAQKANSIAQHVSSEYRLNSAGAPLLAAAASAPEVANGTSKVEVSHIALYTKPSTNSSLVINPTGSTWSYDLCGLGTGCSIASGEATSTRGRLVRREALELALYTFKFVPGINSVVAFMPPPPGETPSLLLYLQKADLTKQLSEPLDKTLLLSKPPLPTAPDTQEAATIDKLTLPAAYSYSITGLQDDSALLIGTPFPKT